MSAEQHALTDLAASIADGAPIDWQGVESGVGARERRLVQHLRLVSSVAELYRSLPPDAPEAHADAAEPSGPRWGHLVILESLGQGTSAEVHRAWDLELHREVALKLFPPDSDGGTQAHARVLSEARRLARVRHPNIATVFGAERHGDRVGLWMELVRGASLQDILDRDGPFGAREIALIGSEVSAALAAVHGAGLLHRDVKAQNVLRENGGRIVLTDFGTGEELGTAPTRMAGTPMYLAPEILRGRPASVQSDIYSLGVLLFLLATGTFPVAATTMMELARGHAEGRRKRLRDLRPDLPSPVANVVEKALSTDPADRYASAGAFDEALRRTFDPASGGAPRSAAAAEVQHRMHPARSAVLLGTLAVLVVLVAALLTLAWWKKTPSPGDAELIDSMAVLPLADLSGREPLLADGITDQLIATLGQIRALRVTSRTSVLPFQATTRPASEIARTLGVSAVLEGTVMVDPPASTGERRVHVTARLISAGSGSELWSGAFDGMLGEVTALQSGIARSIARSIRLSVTPREADRLRPGGHTSADAEEAYFQGRYYLNQYGVDSAGRALKAFQRAVDLDAEYAPAYAGLARAYVTLGFGGALSQPEARARALATATRALALDSDSSEAQAALADLKFYYDWDWQGADAAYARAIDLSPSAAYVRSQYARYLAAANKLPQAVDEAVRASALDPLSAEAAQTEGLMRYYARDFRGAEAALQRAIDIDPLFARAYYVLGRVREAEGRIAEALAATDRAMSLAREPGASWRAQLARLHALAGDHDRARAELRALVRGPLHPRPEHLAYAHLALGESDRAMTLLEQAADERDPALLWLGVDPRVDPLRGSERFATLMTRLGIP